MWAALHPCLRRAGSPVDGLWPTRCEPCRHRTARFDRLGESGRLKIDRDDTLSDGSARDSARVKTLPAEGRNPPHRRQGRASLETEPDDRVPRCGGKPAVYGGRGCHDREPIRRLNLVVDRLNRRQNAYAFRMVDIRGEWDNSIQKFCLIADIVTYLVGVAEGTERLPR